MNLFEYGEAQHDQTRPLAARMRPRNLDEIIGQQHLLGQGKLLRRAIEADQLSSLIFYGPPGTGKTTLAMVIANTTQARFEQLNAVTAGVADIRRLIEEAKERRSMYQEKTLLFIDEIHRLNKSQQDALLPYVEEGTVTLIGATTENPSFEVNNALLSRSRVFTLVPLEANEMIELVTKILADEERGLGSYHVEIDHDALEHVIQVAGGDARNIINALELAVLTTHPNEEGKRRITLEIAEESIQQKRVHYDKNGDIHYDTVSAWIKSMRGSDPDAALYYLAKMLHAGEDPRFILRRLIVHAAEDVGIADPRALQIATAAAQAVEYVGMPEARIPLAEAVIYISTAPKSNAVVTGIDAALTAVNKEERGDVPPHLWDSHGKKGRPGDQTDRYLYPHDYPHGYVLQQYLPDEHLGKQFYHPSPIGYEGKVQVYWEEIKKKSKR
ncbi:replication-associated recombination protein A [Mechercharimyces sp. CAU 1602]|uniref:replication-associated recombination protein A n=1 Tax=Mechercharimyces sp. CAU 1602 TaxID=2973933 RepID=UPI002163146B|nr:replication-associated recombination protein A [Mechercharimyces sp. CAU 1602]MCS1350252.1 replication-associated recombination protein A [Mechercharimyces sp. CAU 1602]